MELALETLHLLLLLLLYIIKLAEECEMPYFTTETMDLMKEVNFHNSQDLAIFILI